MPASLHQPQQFSNVQGDIRKRLRGCFVPRLKGQQPLFLLGLFAQKILVGEAETGLEINLRLPAEGKDSG
jgi:hypothetical protein